MLSSFVRVLRRDAFVLLWYVGLALVAMQSVLPQPRELILGDLGDNIHYVYMVGWSAQAFLLDASPFIDPRLNYPDGLPLSSNDWPYLSYLLLAPATLVLGPVFGYNLAIFFSHLLSGYFTYLWAHRLTGSRLAALFAGTAFMLTPFRLLRSLGHANIVTTQMLPIFFWALDHCLNTRAKRERSLWFLGIATALLASSSQYLLIMSLVCGALYALYAILPDVRFLLLHGWRIAASVLLGTLVGALPSLSVLGANTFTPFAVGRTRIWSADPLNFLLPSSLHPLWGDWVERLRPEPYAGEKTLYVSLVALLLAGIGFWRLMREAQGRRRAFVWGATALSALVFALGTDLWINNEPLQRNDPFWLPAYYLAHLPGLGMMRVWSRFGIITILFVAMFAAFGLRYLLARERNLWRQRILATLVFGLLLLDLMPGPLPASALGPRSIDHWLAAQEGDFAVAFLPVDKPLINDLAIFGSLFHAKQLPAYMHAAHQPRAYQDFAAMALNFPDQRSVDYFAWRKFTYLILDTNEYNGWRAPAWAEVEQRLAEFPELRRVAEVEAFVVLAFEQ
ncbi:hypothetical protein [Candidatus Viridilinea mediisalina]|uniref:DUF6311 domain-containing protein n=1 Tax=Candidatus Viridilinea mediisalina TaxID=2024553 RepID=A0A2A6RMG5_9CHLR|nr:hypothetical protein [Candidatus Viridilinea mediisalina]PDW04252.1 hypothetical protein CJ255_04695 [Candidatus Viridilinea mediisalina]